MNVETHPHKAFVPENIQVLIIGSFPGKGQTDLAQNKDTWYYNAPRNQFWKIISGVYLTELPNTASKQTLFTQKGIGMIDMIAKAIRIKGNNQDSNLEIVAYNTPIIKNILQIHPQVKVLFTSLFVENIFKKQFPHYTNTHRLPSPSPRYAKMSLTEKINQYKEYLPKI